MPAVVTAKVRYGDAYKRSQKNVRTLIPTAEKLNVMILIEEVWNNFLLSPLEFARYIDEIKHPLVQAYFDVGNVQVAHVGPLQNRITSVAESPDVRRIRAYRVRRRASRNHERRQVDPVRNPLAIRRNRTDSRNHVRPPAGIIGVGILAHLEIYFRPTSLFNTLLILVLLVGGLGLVVRSLRAS